MTCAEKNGKPFATRAAEITEQVRAANENLARLVEKSSVDPFGSATRSVIDKLMLVSTIGAVIATVGIVKEVDLGPFKIDVHVVKFIPVFIAITIVFYGASLHSLATTDIRKWWATNRLSATSLQPVSAMILALMAENERIFREQAELFREMIAAGEDIGELDEDEVPLIVKKAAAEADARSEVLKREHAKLLQPVERERKQFAIGLAIFVILPLMFGGLSICLLIYSMIRGLPVLSSI
ncbi:putative membrane protein YqjE [Bradyrhizobium sp. USDA 4011]